MENEWINIKIKPYVGQFIPKYILYFIIELVRSSYTHLYIFVTDIFWGEQKDHWRPGYVWTGISSNLKHWFPFTLFSFDFIRLILQNVYGES